MQEYVKTLQSTLGDLNSTLGNTMEITISARGKSLVYSYKYKIDVTADDSVKSALEQTLSSQDAVFKEVLSSMKAQKVDADSLVVEYLTKKGEVIYSKEYK